MGIKNLKQIIKSSGEKVSLSSFSGKRIVIDVSIFMYRFAYFDNDPIKGFQQQVRYFKEIGLTPIYVFDGIAPSAKSETLEKRKQHVDVIQEKIELLEDKLFTLKYSSESSLPTIKNVRKQLMEKKNQIINVKYTDYCRLKVWFKEENIEWKQSNGEAYTLCAQINLSDSNCIGVLSEDTDMLAFGATSFITGYKNNTNGDVIIYKLSKVLDDLKKKYWEF